MTFGSLALARNDPPLQCGPVNLRGQDHRRNLTVRGVPLNHLVGRRFRVGAVILRGGRLNFPCKYLEKLLGLPVYLPLYNRSGLNCSIERSGIIRSGDEIELLNRSALRLRSIGTVSNVASRLCDEAKPGQIFISPRVLIKVENAVKVEPVGEFVLKAIGVPSGGVQRGLCRVARLDAAFVKRVMRAATRLQQGPRHRGSAGVSRPSQYPAHGAIH